MPKIFTPPRIVPNPTSRIKDIIVKLIILTDVMYWFFLSEFSFALFSKYTRDLDKPMSKRPEKVTKNDVIEI